MQPELELMILCSRSNLDHNQIERIKQLISEGIDWHLLFCSTLSHKVYPLFYRNISKYFPDSIPADIRDKFKNQYLWIAACNLSASHQLVYIIELFEKNNIDVVPFKGPVLAEYLFGDINCRSYADLDILVAKADLQKAILLLHANGYNFDIELNHDQYMQLALAGFHAIMIKGKISCMVELHWELSGRYFSRTLELQDIRSRLQKIGFMDHHHVLSLSPEDLLVYLCIHGNRHYWVQLDSLCSVAGVINREKKLDWQLAMNIAIQFGARRMLLLGCALAYEVFGAVPDINIAEKINREPGLSAVVDRVMNNLFVNLEENRGKLSYRDKVKYHWHTMDHFSDWFRCCMIPLFGPTHSDWLWLRLPARWSRLYYLLRPLRLGVKYTEKMFRGWKKGNGGL